MNPQATATEARHQAFLAMTENDLYQRVEELASLYGWLIAHFRPARTEKGWRTAMQGDTGFPDVVLARDGLMLVRELKRVGQQPRPNQLAWLQATGGLVWTPLDLESGEIERQLVV